MTTLQRLRSHAKFVQETGNCPQPASRLQGRSELPSQHLVPSPLGLSSNSFSTNAGSYRLTRLKSLASQDCLRIPRYFQVSTSVCTN